MGAAVDRRRVAHLGSAVIREAFDASVRFFWTMVQSVPAGGWAVPKHSATRLTYEDYVLFRDDGLRHEIIEGEHFVTPAPSIKHQQILLMLSYLLQGHLEANPIGRILFAPVDVLLSEFNVFVPDLIYLSNERLRFLTEQNLQGVPDLAVEILSPSTRSRDLRLKRDVYERVGVAEYWTIDPKDESVTVLRHAVGSTRFDETRRVARPDVLTTPLLPGLRLDLDKLFS
jgi:Uma2 family endonuclease